MSERIRLLGELSKANLKAVVDALDPDVRTQVRAYTDAMQADIDQAIDAIARARDATDEIAHIATGEYVRGASKNDPVAQESLGKTLLHVFQVLHDARGFIAGAGYHISRLEVGLTQSERDKDINPVS